MGLKHLIPYLDGKATFASMRPCTTTELQLIKSLNGRKEDDEFEDMNSHVLEPCSGLVCRQQSKQGERASNLESYW